MRFMKIFITILHMNRVPRKPLNHKSFISEACVGSSHVFIYKTFVIGNFGGGLIIHNFKESMNTNDE